MASMTDAAKTEAAHINAIADAFIDAFIQRDADALEALYAPDLVMSSPSGKRPGADHVRLIRDGVIDFEDLRYEQARRDVFPGGFVQQHLVCCTLPSGAAMRKPACIVVHIEDGRIVTFDQYFDPAYLRAEPMYQR